MLENKTFLTAGTASRRERGSVQGLLCCRQHNNPSGITHTLRHACRQIIAERGSQCADPAVRLIVHQLAFLVNAYDIDPTEYGRLLDACRAKAGTTA